MADIYLKYPDSTSPTTTIQITRKPMFPVQAQARIPQAQVTTRGGQTYVSQKGPVQKRIVYRFSFLPDGDSTTDYLGIQNFFENIIMGGRRQFDLVDQDASVTTVRLLNDPVSGGWQKDGEGNNSATLEMEEVVS